MSKTRKFTVTIDTDTNGDGVGYTHWVSGFVESIQYVKASSGNYSDGVDFAVTLDTTGEAVWTGTNVNASTVVRPRAVTHSTAGADLLYATEGEEVLDRIALGRDRVKIVVSSGGSAKTGTFVVTIADR